MMRTHHIILWISGTKGCSHDIFQLDGSSLVQCGANNLKIFTYRAITIHYRPYLSSAVNKSVKMTIEAMSGPSLYIIMDCAPTKILPLSISTCHCEGSNPVPLTRMSTLPGRFISYHCLTLIVSVDGESINRRW